MIEVIPAIDIIGGKCVRLSQGDYSRVTEYNDDPLAVARRFEEAGFRRLHLVDLDGAKAGNVTNLKVLEAIASATSLSIDFGGGIKTLSALRSVFSAGASMAAVGSIVVKDPQTFYSWLEEFGPERFFLGADVKEENIAVSGWTEKTNISVFDLISDVMKRGVKNVFCTDVSKDGLLQGCAVELYKDITTRFPDLRLTASGGVSSLEDIDAVEKAGCTSVIVGKAIYEGKISLEALVERSKIKEGTC